MDARDLNCPNAISLSALTCRNEAGFGTQFLECLIALTVDTLAAGGPDSHSVDFPLGNRDAIRDSVARMHDHLRPGREPV